MIQRCERKQDEVRRRMAELHRGAVERWGGEYEGCWGWLAVLVPLLRSYLAGYTLLAFGCAQDRARFVLRPALRQGMIDCALLEDFVD
jgi:hypothetical protein